MRLTIDSNVLVYAAVSEDVAKHRRARAIIDRAAGADCVLTLQSLSETFRALTIRKRVPSDAAANYVHLLARDFDVVAATINTLWRAIEGVRRHGLSFWDAMLWATAHSAACSIIVTEDFQTDRSIDGVTFRNPFATPIAADLDAALLHS